ncbi:aryl hydrocarbon receptor-like [Centroberyx gerrardi]|uniref:aryl hydrocarbon receptor-like n=1 Tax=Centroberyx gerrardi TaxID=166262 RepID=UPI003AB067C5
MLGNGGVYAGKRRKKPVQKNAKPPPGEVPVKTNPSKRHRDRLNGELDRLTSMLPFSQEVRGRLDKLSVLRLSVGYLKAKSYFHATLQKNAWSTPSVSANGRNRQTTSLDGVSFSEGELLLQALNGFVLVVTTDGSIFYTSPTILDFLGFHQSDVVHQSVYDLIHMDDREMFRCQLHFALNPTENNSDRRGEDIQSSSKAMRSSQSYLPQHIPPENSSFLERSFCCRFRCLLDNSSGFLALNFQGRLKYLHCQGKTGDDGTVAPAQLALFAIATPLQPPSVMEIRTKTLIFQTKHRMDFAPMGVDTRGKLVLGYSETELVTTGSGYQFIHAADMMYCADNHLKMIKTGESGFTFFRLLTKTRHWVWVQANARVVFKAGRPDFIIARQKPLTNEEGEEQLRQRRQHLPFNFATGEGVLYDSYLSLDALPVPGPPGSDALGPEEPTTEKPFDPASLLGSLLRQDRSVYAQPQEPSPQAPVFPQVEDPTFNPQLSIEQAFLDSHALLSVPGQLQDSQRRPNIGDHTSQTMFDSLEQILGEIVDGGVGGLEVEETELRDWENALLRMNKEREEESRELNYILASDVFSYVEEALKRETGGYVKVSDQTGSQVAEPVNSLSAPLQHHSPGSVLPSNQGLYSSSSSNDEHQWQIMTDMNSNLSGFGEQALLGNVLGDVGGPEVVTESHRAAHRLIPTQTGTAHQGNTSQFWPSSSSAYHCGNQVVSTPSYNTIQPQPEVADQSWLPSTQSNNNVHNSHHPGLAVTDQSVQYSLALSHMGTGSTNGQRSQQPYMGTQLQGPPQHCEQTLWQQQQQQLPQSLHHHTLTMHSSHTPARANSTAQSFQYSPQTLRLSGSCMFEKREGPIPSSATVPTRQNSPLLAPSCARGSPLTAPSTRTTPFTFAPLPTATFSQSGTTTTAGAVWPAAPYQGMRHPSHASPQVAPHTEMGSISLSQPSGDNSSLGPTVPGYPPEDGSLRPSYFYWNGEAQIPKVPLNGVMDPFTFPALPNGNTNLSQNTGP